MTRAGTSDRLNVHRRRDHGHRSGWGEIPERSTGRHRRGPSSIGTGQEAREFSSQLSSSNKSAQRVKRKREQFLTMCAPPTTARTGPCVRVFKQSPRPPPTRTITTINRAIKSLQTNQRSTRSPPSIGQPNHCKQIEVRVEGRLLRFCTVDLFCTTAESSDGG